MMWKGPDAGRLLFAHANGFNARTYRCLLAPLAPSLDVFAADLRGHGLSTLPAAPGLAKDWTIFAKDLATLLAALGGSPFVLAGHSLGAIASLMAARLAPERVRALVLIEPVLLSPVEPGAAVPPNELARRAATRRAVFSSVSAAFDAYRGRSIFATWPDAVLSDYLSDGLVACDDGTFRLACAPTWESEIFRMAPHDTARLARDISCPVTILHGTIGSASSSQQLGEFRGLKPDTRIVTLAGATHFLPMEFPERVRDEICRIAV